MPSHNRFDFTGQTFSSWSVIGKSEQKGKHGEIYWNCRCVCGTERRVVANTLKLGKSKGCGCALSKGTHGHAVPSKQSRAYTIWAGMRQRCSNPKARSYPRYGARGIVVCERWNDFTHFLQDMGEPPKGQSLERIDNDGPYSPGNCVWATSKEQQRNRAITARVRIGGRTFAVTAVAEVLGISGRLLAAKIKAGWNVKLTLEKE